MTVDKKENRQRALHAAELLHEATERVFTARGEFFDSIVRKEPRGFLRANSTWLASYCMLCSAESQEEENRRARKISRRISIH